jgi:hypothetical protein
MPNIVGRAPQRQSDPVAAWLFEQAQALPAPPPPISRLRTTPSAQAGVTMRGGNECKKLWN